MRALLAAAIVAVGVGALGASNALASAANGAAIAKAADETRPAVAVAAGTAGRAADAGAIERTNPQAHRSLTAGHHE